MASGSAWGPASNYRLRPGWFVRSSGGRNKPFGQADALLGVSRLPVPSRSSPVPPARRVMARHRGPARGGDPALLGRA